MRRSFDSIYDEPSSYQPYSQPEFEHPAAMRGPSSASRIAMGETGRQLRADVLERLYQQYSVAQEQEGVGRDFDELLDDLERIEAARRAQRDLRWDNRGFDNAA